MSNEEAKYRESDEETEVVEAETEAGRHRRRRKRKLRRRVNQHSGGGFVRVVALWVAKAPSGVVDGDAEVPSRQRQRSERVEVVEIQREIC